MSKEEKIDRVILKIGEKEIELTVEEARKLKTVLDDMLGDQQIVREWDDRWFWHYDHWKWNPVLIPANPLYPKQPYKPAEIWCGTSDNTLNIKI